LQEYKIDRKTKKNKLLAKINKQQKATKHNNTTKQKSNNIKIEGSGNRNTRQNSPRDCQCGKRPDPKETLSQTRPD